MSDSSDLDEDENMGVLDPDEEEEQAEPSSEDVEDLDDEAAAEDLEFSEFQEDDVGSSQVFNYCVQAFQSYISRRQSVKQAEERTCQQVIQQLIEYRGFQHGQSILRQPEVTLYTGDNQKTLLHINLKEAFPSDGKWIRGLEPCHTLIFMYLVSDGKIGVATARQIRALKSHLNFTHLLLVARFGLTSQGKKELHGICPVNHFMLSEELKTCYIEHAMVPFQRALTPVETKAFFTKYKYVNRKNMPTITRNDMMCKFFGWAVGQVIESRRVFGGTQEVYPFYRIVK
uniref:RNA polymerase subunit H/Rpb5 C-terminal domain-containing protein n=1 Tax=viral metagenome TaxID=1070528 RepID=A0A6C0BQ56_9ZZZZ